MANTTIYLIDSTDGGTSFAIQPRTFDGTGGVQANTDLTLYGNATPGWGERFNENFYRILENFAVTQTVPFVITNTTPPIPKSQTELGTGHGINNPVIGQMWYNKSDEKVYVYTTNGWKGTGTASSTQPASPTAGDFWYDGSASLMNFWNGGSWVRLETSVGGSFVSTAGDIMSGALEISTNATNTQLNLHSTTGTMLFMKSDSTTFGASTPPSILMYNPDNDPSINGANGANWPYVRYTNRANHYFDIEADNVFGPLTGNSILFADQLTGELVYNIGEALLLGSQISNITNNKHIATKEYVDSVAGGGGFVSKSGDTMTGNLTFDTSGGDKEIVFDPGSNFVAGGPIKLAYIGNELVFQSNFGSGGVKNLLTLQPTSSSVSLDYPTTISAVLTVSGGVSITNGTDLSVSSGSRVVLGQDPILNLEAATKQYVDSTGGVASGFIMVSPANSTPPGFLRCNGAAMSRSVYSVLFAVIGTTYGIGDGSTTFNLPDLRGEFIRGWDDGRGADLGRGMGTWQVDEFKSHNHVDSPSRRLLTVGSTHYINNGSGAGSNTGGLSPLIATGGTETRPRNVAMLFVIKF